MKPKISLAIFGQTLSRKIIYLQGPRFILETLKLKKYSLISQLLYLNVLKIIFKKIPKRLSAYPMSASFESEASKLSNTKNQMIDFLKKKLLDIKLQISKIFEIC